MNNKNKRALGFSLLELMIILAISAILVQLAIPSYKTHIDRAHALKAEIERMEQEIVAQNPEVMG